MRFSIKRFVWFTLLGLAAFILSRSIVVTDRIDVRQATLHQLERVGQTICTYKQLCAEMPAYDPSGQIKTCDRCNADTECRVSLKKFELIKEDLWHNPIDYKVDQNSVTLTSFGSDRIAGGTGTAADIIHVVTCP